MISNSALFIQILSMTPLQKSLLIIIIVFELAASFDLTYQQFLDSTPQTFGLLTVTHARGGQYSYFKEHLKKYAEMECQLMTEFSVVWNNDITPQEAGIKESPTWKRPVYFIKTAYNSMDFRYNLPKESKAQIFFSIDDDVTIDCKQLVKGFGFWKSHAIGDIAPLMGYAVRGFDTVLEKSQFKYTDPKTKGDFFLLILIGIAWVPRHFFEIYNSNSFWELQEMRKIVQSKNNCDDIALNYIVNHLYPELNSIKMEGKFQMVSPKIAQSYTSNHYTYRTQCVKDFIQILGYCPLNLIDQKFESQKANKPIFENPMLNKTLYLKRKLYEQKFIEEKPISYDASQISEPSVKDAMKSLEEENIKLKQKVSEMETILQQKIKKEATESSLTKIQIVVITLIGLTFGLIAYFSWRKNKVSYRIVEENSNLYQE